MLNHLDDLGNTPSSRDPFGGGGSSRAPRWSSWMKLCSQGVSDCSAISPKRSAFLKITTTRRLVGLPSGTRTVGSCTPCSSCCGIPASPTELATSGRISKPSDSKSAPRMFACSARGTASSATCAPAAQALEQSRRPQDDSASVNGTNMRAETRPAIVGKTPTPPPPFDYPAPPPTRANWRAKRSLPVAIQLRRDGRNRNRSRRKLLEDNVIQSTKPSLGPLLRFYHPIPEGCGAAWHRCE